MSAGAYRTRWDRVLQVLQVPKSAGLTPGSLRGGGAVAAYRRGVPITELLWQMRLKHAVTLEHYLQEVAAVSVAAELPERTRTLVRVAASVCEATIYDIIHKATSAQGNQ